MLIDYLRYVAFRGRLRAFFTDGLSNFVEPSATTGQHLRFAPDYLQHLGYPDYVLARYADWGHPWSEIFHHIRFDLGQRESSSLLGTEPLKLGGLPSTFRYEERKLPPLEIIIDIDPDQWDERYDEPRNYEQTPVFYRRAGPARANLKSGDRLFDNRKGRSGHGTLCGIFCTSAGDRCALTCGHVIDGGGEVSIERHRRIWKFPLWSAPASLGKTRHVVVPDAASHGGPARVQLDAALITVEPTHMGTDPNRFTQARLQPISTKLQETPVRFRGAGRKIDTFARIAAACVRKSMDLFGDGTLRDVGDVLLLGHLHPMYIAQRVSRPGDSGAAVREVEEKYGMATNRWHGMILGGDDCGAYATYAEHLWSWAQQKIGEIDMFVFDA